jgi:replicative DNA helicase
MNEIPFKIDTAMEMSLLGSVLRRNEFLDEKPITRDLFYSLETLAIYDKIIESRAHGSTVTADSLSLLLPEKWQDIDMCRKYTTANVDEVITRLREQKLQRGTVNLLASLTAMLKDDMPSAEVLETLSKQMSLLYEAKCSEYRTCSDVMASALKMIEDRSKKGAGICGIPSGLPRLDDWTDGFQDGDYIIIGARTSVGKTALALSILLKAITQDYRAGFFSFEMSPERLMYRVFGIMTDIQIWEMRKGKVRPDQIDQLRTVANVLAVPERLYFGNNRGMNIDALVTQARLLKRKEKIDVLFVDYFGLIAPSGGNKKHWEDASETSNRLKSLAIELNIPIIVLSQLGREAEGKSPTLANLRDSGSLEQDADVVILLHANTQKPDELKLILAKHRQGETGTIDLYFNKAKQTFGEIERQKSYVDTD